MEKILHFDSDAITKMDKRFRANFINSVTGYKSANLLGTISNKGIPNLAIFSSVTHLGSNPALLGFITRPAVVPRHTYQNILENKQFTVNHIHSDIIQQSHQTAARYDEEVSEFDITGLTAEYLEGIQAPFVKEAHIKIACRYVNEYRIKENNTVLVVAEIKDIYLPEASFIADGWIDLSITQGVTINGLDSYASPKPLDRFAYAKPDQPIRPILKKE